MRMITEQKAISYAINLSNLKLLPKKKHNFEKMKYTINNFKCCHVLDHLHFILNPSRNRSTNNEAQFHTKNVKKKFCSFKPITLKESGPHLKK